uniref:Uncharacterized protein MANES_14G081200 n=1 Tax=Rhizophora mucronata TaxID=61149 RepID=A0A2P2PMP7_RHIMU
MIRFFNSTQITKPLDEYTVSENIWGHFKLFHLLKQIHCFRNIPCLQMPINQTIIHNYIGKGTKLFHVSKEAPCCQYFTRFAESVYQDAKSNHIWPQAIHKHVPIQGKGLFHVCHFGIPIHQSVIGIKIW